METVTAYTPHKFTDSARNTFLTGKPKRTAPQIVCMPLNPTPGGHHQRGHTLISRKPRYQKYIQEKNLPHPKKETNLSQQKSTD